MIPTVMFRGNQPTIAYEVLSAIVEGEQLFGQNTYSSISAISRLSGLRESQIYTPLRKLIETGLVSPAESVSYVNGGRPWKWTTTIEGWEMFSALRKVVAA